MADQVVDGKCPYCGGVSGFYKKTIYRVRQDFSFENHHEPNAAFYSEVSGGVETKCIDCNKRIKV